MKKVIVLIVVFGLIGGIFLYKKWSNPRYKTYDVKKTRLVESVYASGYIDSTNAVVIKSEVSGIVERLFVKEGDTVRAGQVLATIKNDILRENLAETRAQLELVRQRLREDSDFLADIKNTISIKKAVYENALRNFQRKRALYDEGLISKERFDEAERDLEISKRDYNRQENILRDTLKSLESQYKGLIHREGAIISEIQRHTVKSPISGTILRRFVKEGDYVNTLNQTNEIFSVGNRDDIETVLMIDEENVPLVKKGMKVIVTSDPFVNEVFEGTLLLIDSQS
ncbi:MAG: biotin/lipoyl-binding protein, partial [Thermodesulfovibrionales bacterium]